MRLIDADALDDLIESHLQKHKISRYDRDLILHYTDVEMAPTIEAEPVKRGKWIYNEKYPNAHYGFLECSECEQRLWVRYDIPINYCPRCGAKMEAENENK